MLPNFIIVGAPKAGTTSLYHYLSEHPDVFMSEPKEVNFFSKEEIESQGLYYADFKAKSMVEYEGLFNGVTTQKAIGEGSVSYLFYPKTPQKIKEALPEVKVIMLLRDPIERAFSHYLMDLRLGLVNVPFEDIVSRVSEHKSLPLFYQQYVELGLYYSQVKRYLDTFGKDKVKIYFQEDLRHKSDEVIMDLYTFLGVDTSYSPDINREHNVFSMPKNRLMRILYASNFMRSLIGRAFPDKLKEAFKGIVFEQKKKPEMLQQTRKTLRKLYLQDIEQLEQLLGKDLTSWK